MEQLVASLRNDLRVWVLAARPVTLTASLVPVLLGTALVAEAVEIDWLLFTLAVLGAGAIQVGTNLADEYVDHRGSRASAKFPAPHKVIQRGLLSERAVLLGTALCFAAGAGMGLYIVSRAGWPILVAGIFSLLAGYLYSSGPFPLGKWGLGEVTVFVFMGPLIVMASYYVQVQELTWRLFWASVPIGLLVAAILQGNNLRDLDEDRAEGKHTLVTMFGARPGRWTYAALLVGAYVALAVNIGTRVMPPSSLIAMASLPWALLWVRRLWAAKARPDFNRVLVGTAKLHLVAGLLMALGVSLQVATSR